MSEMVTTLKTQCIYWSAEKTLDMTLGRPLHHLDAYICWPRVAHLTQIVFFWKMINIILLYLLTSFIKEKIKEILGVNPESWRCIIFRSKMTHLTQTTFFWEKTVNVAFIHSLWKKFKKIFTANPGLWRCIIFRPRNVNLLQEILFLEIQLM